MFIFTSNYACRIEVVEVAIVLRPYTRSRNLKN